jgi:hypothetical protein
MDAGTIELFRAFSETRMERLPMHTNLAVDDSPSLCQRVSVTLRNAGFDEIKPAGRAANAAGGRVEPCDPAPLIEGIGKVVR